MDLIDRQTVVDAIEHHEKAVLGEHNYTEGIAYGYATAHKHLVDIVKQLPSAEPRIIRCKDCKHRPAFRDDEDGNRYVEGPRYQETLKNGLTVTLEDTGCPCVNGLDSYFSYIPKDDWFCANGERRQESGKAD